MFDLVRISIFSFVVISLFPLVCRAASDDFFGKGSSAGISEQWLRLLHYYPNSIGWKSTADNPDFFVSPSGKVSPQEELSATLSMLRNAEETESIQCRFPARTKWLKVNFGLLLKPIKCPQLESWLGQYSFSEMSIFFASTDIKRPASMFGHTFLWVPSAIRKTKMSGMTFNYVAEGADSKGVSYLYQGIVGGHSSVIEVSPLYSKLKRYNQVDGRDLWEYPLELTETEIEFLVLHMWEVKGRAFNYYFFKENCSYQALAILNVVRPELDFLSRFSWYALPIDVIRELKNQRLISRKPVYWPSYDSDLQMKFSYLSKGEKQLSKKLVFDKQVSIESELNNYPDMDKKSVLDVSFDYVSLQIARDGIDRNRGKSLLNNIILERSKYTGLSPASVDRTSGYPVVSPELGHKNKRLQVTAGIQGAEPYSQLGYRGAYHDVLDSPASYTAGSTVSVLQLEYRIYHNGHDQLERFDLIDIQARSQKRVFEAGGAWNFLLSRRQKELNKNHQLINTIQYQKGLMVGNEMVKALAYLGVSVDQSRDFEEDFAVESQIKFELLCQSSNFSYLIDYELGSYLLGSDSTRHIASLSMAYSVTKSHRLVLNSQFSSAQVGGDLSLSYRYYY